jgi:type IV secretion system protein VirB6
MGFIEQILSDFDAAIAGYVQAVFGNLTTALSILWRAFLALVFCFWGYRTLYSGKFQGDALLYKIFIMVLVLAFCTNWGIYSSIVYDMATNFPNEFASFMVAGKGQTLDSANAALTNYIDNGFNVSLDLIKKGSFAKAMYWFYGGIAFLATLSFAVIALCLILLSKLALALLLAIGPVYILTLMFDSTQSLFRGWLSTLLNYALIPVLVYGLLALVSYIIGPRVAELMRAEQGVGNITIALVAYVLALFGSAFLATQLLAINSGITGGHTLSGLGRFTRESVKNSYKAMRATKSGSHRTFEATKKGLFMANAARSVGADAIGRALQNTRRGGRI